MKLTDLPKDVQELVMHTLSMLRELMEHICVHGLESDYDDVEDFSQHVLTLGAMLQEINEDHEIDQHKLNKLLGDLHIDL